MAFRPRLEEQGEWTLVVDASFNPPLELKRSKSRDAAVRHLQKLLADAQCHGKIAFADEHRANCQAGADRKKFKNRDIRVYHCEKCKQWHLTSKPQKPIDKRVNRR